MAIRTASGEQSEIMIQNPWPRYAGMTTNLIRERNFESEKESLRKLNSLETLLREVAESQLMESSKTFIFKLSFFKLIWPFFACFHQINPASKRTLPSSLLDTRYTAFPWSSWLFDCPLYEALRKDSLTKKSNAPTSNLHPHCSVNRQLPLYANGTAKIEDAS